MHGILILVLVPALGTDERAAPTASPDMLVAETPEAVRTLPPRVSSATFNGALHHVTTSAC